MDPASPDHSPEPYSHAPAPQATESAGQSSETAEPTLAPRVHGDAPMYRSSRRPHSPLRSKGSKREAKRAALRYIQRESGNIHDHQEAIPKPLCLGSIRTATIDGPTAPCPPTTHVFLRHKCRRR